jgi:tetratricopeptide (TPR) repeat protein
MKSACPYLRFLSGLARTLILTIGLVGYLPSPALAGDDLDDLTRQFNQFYREGRFQEAARVGERALSVAEKSYGPEHLKVAEVLDALGVTYNSLKDYKKALSYIERALAIYKRTPGEQSKEMVHALNTLAMNYDAQEKFVEAQDTYEKALGIAEKVLPPNDEMRATLYNNRGQLFSDQDQFKEAAADYERALEILEKDQGKAYWDPKVALTMNNLAYAKKKLGDVDDAMMLYERSLKILERGVGRDNPDHPYIAAVLENLAALYELKGWKEEAQEAAARAKQIRSRRP